MKNAWLIFATVCAASCSVVVAFDLGPMIWAAQCQSECLKQLTQYHEIRPNVLDDFNECVKYCKMCHDGKNTNVCEQPDVSKRVPKRFRQDKSEQIGKTIACEYCRTRELTSYEPSMLPAPENKTMTIGPHDVAIMFQRQHQHWKFEDFYYGKNLIGMVYPCHWVIVVTENGLRHYTWQGWVPNLDSLKEGPLVEATISWQNVNQQLEFQRKFEKSEMMTRNNLHYLQLSSEEVLMITSHNKIQREVIQQLFWKPDASESKWDQNRYWGKYPKTCRNYLDNGDNGDNGDNSDNDIYKSSLVVTWGPETGGLTGNQVADGDSAQISLLPGVKYQVRVASNDGPGSFPIVIDTRHLVNDTAPSSPSCLACESCMTLFKKLDWHYFLILLMIIVVMMLSYCASVNYISELHDKNEFMKAKVWEKA